MIRNLLPLSALLLGSAFLLFAGGVNALILPVRGEAEGFSAAALGLLGTGWAIGYVAGCLVTPVLVARVGHIRAFGAMCAVASIAVLLSLVLMTPWVWIPVRALSGFCFAGAAMIVESWLNERAEPSSRGRTLASIRWSTWQRPPQARWSSRLGMPTGSFSLFWPPWSIAWRCCPRL